MICYDEKLGSEFFRLDECKHHFCVACMTDMCQMHVKEGTVQLLKCPGEKCDEFVAIDVMRAVLTSAEFERWER
jgi:E3 ubiquitin-protein ligase RNF14